MKSGIDVLDRVTHQSYGKSKKCASKAVTQTAISRIFLGVTMFVPPLALIAIEEVNLMPESELYKFILEIALLAGELYFAAPIGLAMYDRQGTITANELEESFHSIKNE